MENSVQPETRAAWRAWLTEHHGRDFKQGRVWLITYKKAAGKPRIEYDEAVEEALCFGWVDSKPGKVVDERTKLWFAPRKARRDARCAHRRDCALGARQSAREPVEAQVSFLFYYQSNSAPRRCYAGYLPKVV